MKVLIVSTCDIEGGAARAAYRLHRALVDNGIDSQMLVIDKRSDDFSVLLFIQNFGKLRNTFRKFQFRFFNAIKSYPKKTKTLFSSSFLDYSNITDVINKINPDIVHLHWICGEMIKVEDIARIKASIVWSLHDMWAFTGGCHYDEECGRYVDSCGNCKVLGSKVDNDLSKNTFKRKQKTFSKINDMTIVGLSGWIANCAAQSFLFKQKKIISIPNLIDVDKFKPINKVFAREIYSLPKDKKLILFGAMSATSDPRKGFKYLQQAINMVQMENIELIVFGSGKPEVAPELKFKTHYLGRIYDDESLLLLYSACDVMLVPSVQENLSNTIMESLSCATPVVAFSIGGNADLIDHKLNGYLAMPFDSLDFAHGIEYILNSANYNELCENARYKIRDKFDSKVVVKQFINLYTTLIK